MKEQLIGRVPLFASLPQAELTRLASTLVERDIAAGVCLFSEGESGEHFYIILEGQVEIIKALGTDDERLLAVRSSGEFIGEMSLLSTDGVRTASVRTRTPVHLLELTRQDFNALLQRHPLLGYTMGRVLSDRLSVSQNNTIRDLHAKNQQLTDANRQLSDAYHALQQAQAHLIEKERLERELQVAREMQESILPRTLPRIAGFACEARMLPARAVGGDFYDVIPLRDGRWGIVVGDVSDKGVPAALFMALTCSVLRAEARHTGSPRELLLNVNQLLLDLSDAGMFVTLWYGVLDPVTRVLAYVRAGHELPLFRHADGTLTRLPYQRGQPLGITPTPELDEGTLTLEAGSLLLIHTDGVTDALDEHGSAFGLERLQTAVRTVADASAPVHAVCDGIINAVHAYCGAVPQYDDLTLMSVRAL